MATTGGPLNLMACVRESSPQDLQPDSDTSRHETSKKRRFHPFRGLRRMFRRKVRHAGGEEELPPEELPGVDPGPALESHRSRSTSELLAADDAVTRRRSGNGLYPCHSGLSVSHDSVFTAEQRTPHSSSEDLDTAQSSSSLSIQQLVPGVRRELLAAVQRRRGRGDTSEEDEDLGLPRSPCNSPTTADVLLEPGIKLQENPSRSTGSDGSLLSMGSSEMDEDSSGHSGKMSMSDKRNAGDMDLDVPPMEAPLSHDAARHKMAVKPKRKYGPPRRRKAQQQIGASPLPATPEVNEELSGRSASPEIKPKHDFTAELSTSEATPLETQLKSASLPPGLALSSSVEASVKVARSHSNAAYRQTEPVHYKRTISASELDSSIATALASEVLARTREMFGPVGEEEEEEKAEPMVDDKTCKEKEDKKEESFLGRLLLRRSGKKKKDKCDETDAPPPKIVEAELPPTIPKRIDEKGRYANETVVESSSVRHFSSKSSAASRQRIEPINLPPSPEPERKEEPLSPITPPVPAPRLSIESEKVASSRMRMSYSVSPPKPTWPELRKAPEPVPEKRLSEPAPEQKVKSKIAGLSSYQQRIAQLGSETNPEETLLEPGPEQKVKSKIAGLSSYQQRIAQLGSEADPEEREFSSLITTIDDTFIPKVSVKKSKSFRGDVDFMSGSLSASAAEKPKRSSSVTDDSEDRLSLLSSVTAATQVLNGDEVEVEETKQYTKNIYITPISTDEEEPEMKKSLSLDSISNEAEVTESCLTQQITGPVGPTGISITQTVQLHEETRITTTATKVESVTVTLQPESSTEQQDLPKVSRVKRDSRPIITPEPQIPEFLRVQLNPVDSKPAVNVVLSTSAVFDADTPRMQSRLRSVVDKPASVQVNPVVETSETMRVKKDVVTSVIDKPALVQVNPVVETSETARVKKDGVTSDDAKRKFSREETEPAEEPAAVVVKSQRVISVASPTRKSATCSFPPLSPTAVTPNLRCSIPPLSPTAVTPNLRCSIPPLSPTAVTPNLRCSMPPLSPTAVTPNLRKQSTSSDSGEGRNSLLKKQMSVDSEKDQPAVENVQETSYQEVVIRKKSIPWEIVLKKDEDSVVLVEKANPESEESIEVAPAKKSKSREFGSKKDEELQDSSVCEVVLRKKSLSREVGQRKEEEPELLKVFARRSLKLKDSESEALSQQVTAKARESQSACEQQVARSRDSDKENEGGDSPREERKRQSAKEPLVSSEMPVKSSNNGRSSTPAGFKFPRSFNNGNSDNTNPSEPVLAVYHKDNTASPEKRQRSKTVPESPRVDAEKNSHRLWASIYKENNLDLSSSDPTPDKEEANIPKFKRIQQRKEEWELRAQQAAKKTLP